MINSDVLMRVCSFNSTGQLTTPPMPSHPFGGSDRESLLDFILDTLNEVALFDSERFAQCF